MPRRHRAFDPKFKSRRSSDKCQDKAAPHHHISTLTSAPSGPPRSAVQLWYPDGIYTTPPWRFLWSCMMGSHFTQLLFCAVTQQRNLQVLRHPAERQVVKYNCHSKPTATPSPLFDHKVPSLHGNTRPSARRKRSEGAFGVWPGLRRAHVRAESRIERLLVRSRLLSQDVSPRLLSSDPVGHVRGDGTTIGHA